MTEEKIDPGTAFLLEAFDPVNRTNPYPLYERMRTNSPVLSADNGLWFTFTHEAANTMLRAKNVSSDERRSTGFKDQVDNDPQLQKLLDAEPLMLFADPPDHTRLRSLVSRAFTPRTVERLIPRMRELTDSLLDAMDETGEHDLLAGLAYPLPIAVITELLGVPKSDIPVFREWSDDLTLMIEPGPLRTPEQNTAMEIATEDLSAYLSGLLDDRRKKPGDDLISELLAARDGEDRLSESELINMVLLLLFAGYETTVNLIGNAAVALLRNQDQLQAWRADPSLDKTAVDELLRYDSPVQIGMRVTLEPVTFDGVTIPANDVVISVLGSANRDAAMFDTPDTLDLHRANAARNMSFGGGIHHCLGMALARVEGQIVLGSLARRFKHLELVEEPETRPRFVLRGYEAVRVTTR